MPEETLQTATTTPITHGDQGALAAWLVAEVTAWPNNVEAPGGCVLFSPVTSRCPVPDPIWVKLATPISAISAGTGDAGPVV
jgi:hypothetical protein